MKKLFLLMFSFLLLLCGCSKRHSFIKADSAKNLKVGFVFNGSINDNGFCQAKNAGRFELEKYGIKTLYAENVPETEVSKAVFVELVKQGCKIIFAVGEGYNEYVFNIAEKFPGVKFIYDGGRETSYNVSCFSEKMYEGRYLAGIVAGLNTTSNKIGYVAAFNTPEYIRSINAFTFGVKAVNPDAEVYVRWINSGYNPMEENYKAEELVNFGCDLLVQHVNSVNLHYFAKSKGVYLIGNNYPVTKIAPDYYLTSVCVDWNSFVIEQVKLYVEGKWQSGFYWKGMNSGCVYLSRLSEHCAPGSAGKVEEAENKILSGQLNIFKGPLYDDRGFLRLKENEAMNDDALWNMDWFVAGVKVYRF